MFALVMSAAAIVAAVAAVLYIKLRSERAAQQFQDAHKEQVKLLVVEVKECRDALTVMATSIGRLNQDDDRLDDLSESRKDRLKSLEEELASLNDRITKITRQVKLSIDPQRF